MKKTKVSKFIIYFLNTLTVVISGIFFYSKMYIIWKEVWPWNDLWQLLLGVIWTPIVLILTIVLISIFKFKKEEKSVFSIVERILIRNTLILITLFSTIYILLDQNIFYLFIGWLAVISYYYIRLYLLTNFFTKYETK